MFDIGIEIGGTKLQVVVGERKSNVIHNTYREQGDKEKGAAGILEKIETIINNLNEKPQAIGVGFGGPLDRINGRIAASHQIGGWSGFDMKGWFTSRYNVPVFIDNDANTAALAEALYGAGKDHDFVFYITLGSGVGGGMVVNQSLYHGGVPGEAEIGLMQIDRDGNTLESSCSGWALDTKIKNALAANTEESPLRKLVGNVTSGQARFLTAAMEQGDSRAKKIFDEYVDTLSWGLSHVVHLFHPQVIVLGGGVSLIGEPLRQATEKTLPRYIVSTYRPGPLIKLSALHENVVPIGALNLISE